MLILTRKRNERVFIFGLEGILVEVVNVTRSSTRLMIQALPAVKIRRGELPPPTPQSPASNSSTPQDEGTSCGQARTSLVLTRKTNEKIHIGDSTIVLTVVSIKGDEVRLGLEAPKNIPIYREECLNHFEKAFFQRLAEPPAEIPPCAGADTLPRRHDGMPAPPSCWPRYPSRDKGGAAPPAEGDRQNGDALNVPRHRQEPMSPRKQLGLPPGAPVTAQKDMGREGRRS